MKQKKINQKIETIKVNKWYSCGIGKSIQKQKKMPVNY